MIKWEILLKFLFIWDLQTPFFISRSHTNKNLPDILYKVGSSNMKWNDIVFPWVKAKVFYSVSARVNSIDFFPHLALKLSCHSCQMLSSEKHSLSPVICRFFILGIFSRLSPSKEKIESKSFLGISYNEYKWISRSSRFFICPNLLAKAENEFLLIWSHSLLNFLIFLTWVKLLKNSVKILRAISISVLNSNSSKQGKVAMTLGKSRIGPVRWNLLLVEPSLWRVRPKTRSLCMLLRLSIKTFWKGSTLSSLKKTPKLRISNIWKL